MRTARYKALQDAVKAMRQEVNSHPIVNTLQMGTSGKWTDGRHVCDSEEELLSHIHDDYATELANGRSMINVILPPCDD